MEPLEMSLVNFSMYSDDDGYFELGEAVGGSIPDDRNLLLTTTFVSASLMTCFCLSGLYGNVMSAIVFLHPSMRAPINVLLTALSLVDFALLFLAIPVFIVPSFNVLIGDATLKRVYQFSSLGLYPLNMTAHTSSIWTFVLISIERYLAVCQPLNRHKLLTYREAKYAQIVVVVSALFYNLVRFWEYKPASEKTGIEALLRENEFYFIFYYTTLYVLTHFVAPFTIILVLNFAIVRSLKRSSSSCYSESATSCSTSGNSVKTHKFSVVSQSQQFDIGQRQTPHSSHVQQQQRKVTLMIVVITLMFAGCNAPAFALNIYETFDPHLFKGPWRSVAYLTLDVSNLLILLNSSSTFLVYMAFCRKYRSLFAAYAKIGCCLRSGRLALRRVAERRSAGTGFGNGQTASGGAVYQSPSTLADRIFSPREHQMAEETSKFLNKSPDVRSHTANSGSPFSSTACRLSTKTQLSPSCDLLQQIISE